jgi:hypothetical protein
VLGILQPLGTDERQTEVRRTKAQKLTTADLIRKFKALLLGGRPMVGLQTLDLAIGVRVPASQPNKIIFHWSFDIPQFSFIGKGRLAQVFINTRLVYLSPCQLTMSNDQ